MAAFEHPVLTPLYQVLSQQRQDSPETISAANAVAQRLLQSAYLGNTYHHWHLLERAPGEVRLYQWLPNQEWMNRDPFLLFYRDPLFEDSMRGSEEQWMPTPRPETIPLPAHPSPHRPTLSTAVLTQVEALLQAVQAHAPEATRRLLTPTPRELSRRQHLVVQALSPTQLGNALQTLLGPLHDSSLRAYGIDYHTAPSYGTPDSNVYLLAHNGEEVAGLMKLGTGTGWGYGVGYVCVAPGFRHQGLSQRLYQVAIDRCLQDQKVLIRSDPGDQTPRQATLAFDRLVLSNPVLHTTFHSPAEQGFKLLHEKGVPYEQWLANLKPACDAAVRTPEQRLAGDHVASYQQRNDWVAQHGQAFEELLKDVQPKPRRPRP